MRASEARLLTSEIGPALAATGIAVPDGRDAHGEAYWPVFENVPEAMFAFWNSPAQGRTALLGICRAPPICLWSCPPDWRAAGWADTMDLMATTHLAKALADNLDQIAAICARHGVAWLYAFGSAVRDD